LIIDLFFRDQMWSTNMEYFYDIIAISHLKLFKFTL